MKRKSIELIEPVDQASTWKEALNGKVEGVHHIAFGVNDTTQVVKGLAEKMCRWFSRATTQVGCTPTWIP